MELLVNIDVEDLERAEAFFTTAFDLAVARRFGMSGVELAGGSSRIYLLEKEQGTRATASADTGRDYRRHWTPVHLDFVVEDIEPAVKRALDAGAQLEHPVSTETWGRLARMADPFGHGFCLVQFLNQGYDEITSGP